LHCLIPAGVISPDKHKWIHAKANFLFPVRALSKVFRGKFIDLLTAAFKDEKLRFPGKAQSLAAKRTFTELLKQLWRKDWVVYSKKTFSSPKTVLDYLGRYTHRIAISNHRLKSINNDKVSFTYRDRTDDNKVKLITLGVNEFIRRFLLHVLPKSYMRIRHFGFLANKSKKVALTRCRELLNCQPQVPPLERPDAQAMFLSITGVNLNRCPCCKRGTMKVVAELLPTRSANLPVAGIDSS
jgi:hypothetical protein